MIADFLKYRIWDEALRRYVSERVFVNHHGEVCLIATGCFYDHGTVVEHCTGWQDKNRKLIYAGDVVDHEDHGRLVVVWSDNYMQFYLADGKGLRHPLCYDMPPTLEVVGTIHDDEQTLNTNA